MRKFLIVVAVIVAVLLPLTIVWGQSDRELKAQLYDALVVICGEAPVTHVQKQAFIIDEMRKAISASPDTAMVGKLAKVGIKLQ